VLLDKNADGTYKDPAKADELLALISRWTSVPPKAIAQSLAYIDTRLDVGSIYEMVEWYRDQRMIEKNTDPRTFIDLTFVPGHENVPAAMSAAR
jgi:NitT/TauT family transport system substrate-binding protein